MITMMHNCGWGEYFECTGSIETCKYCADTQNPTPLVEFNQIKSTNSLDKPGDCQGHCTRHGVELFHYHGKLWCSHCIEQYEEIL